MTQNAILVTGLHGFIGSRLVDMVNNKFAIWDAKHHGVKLDSKKINKVIKVDLTDRKEVFSAISKFSGSVVVHLAAKTHIDLCEIDRPLGKQGMAWKVNVVGTKNIAQACKKFDKFLLFLSTECVFDGQNRFYNEKDRQNPINWYGVVKQAAEEEVIKSGCQHCILRSVLAYGHPKRERQDLFRLFTDKLFLGKKIKAVYDQKISFTFIDDLIRVILKLAERKIEGFYHYAGGKALSPFEFACLLKEKLNIKKGKIVPVSSVDFFGEEKSRLRLKYASLSSKKLEKRLGISASDINNSIHLLKERL